VCPAVAYELGQGRAERFGNRDVVLAEADEDGVVTARDLAGGDCGDAGQLLAVKQEQAAGHAVGGVEAAVVQEPAGV